MKLLIVEDEYHAQKHISNLINKVIPNAQILDTIDSVEDALEWFQNHTAPDLIFMDIQLADGLSFDIFRKVKIDAPVIFTTAFDQYTLQAFKVNSVDYLLKPIDEIDLENAIEKYHQLFGQANKFDHESLLKVINSFQEKKAFRQRFLIKQGNEFIYLPIQETAYFYSNDGLTFLVDRSNKRHVVDQSIDALIKELDPKSFYRINRKQVIQLNAIEKISTYFNHRLKLQLRPTSKIETIVARDRVKEFKAWLDR